MLPFPIEALTWLLYNLHTSGPLNLFTQLSATRDLIIIAFYFLLRVSEYTPKLKASQRTVPLRKMDIQLWRGTNPISCEASIDELLTADGASIRLDNQKNGERGQALYQAATRLPLDPISALARRLHNLNGLPASTGIFTFVDPHSGSGAVTPKNITDALKIAATATDLPAKGFPLSQINTHSLRAGGATALFLAGQTEALIQKLGRWKDSTYQKYVHPAIQSFKSTQRNISRLMTKATLQLIHLAPNLNSI